MSRVFFTLIAVCIVVVAGAASAQSDEATTQPSQPSPETSEGCGELTTLSSETCTLLGK